MNWNTLTLERMNILSGPGRQSREEGLEVEEPERKERKRIGRDCRGRTAAISAKSRSIEISARIA